MALNITTTETNIAALSVSGLTIYTQATAPDTISANMVPLLMPAERFVESAISEPRSMGVAGAAVYETRYTLTYYLYDSLLYHATISGTQRAGVTSRIEALAAAIKAADTTLGPRLVTINPAVEAQELLDEAGHSFVGGIVTLTCIESLA